MATRFYDNDNCLVCLNERRDIEIEPGIITILSKYFWFKEEDYCNRLLCSICWNKINNFDQFIQEIKILHDNYPFGVKVKTENIDVLNIKEEFEDAIDNVITENIEENFIDIFTCEKCGDQFKDKASLRKHVRSHITTNQKNRSIFCKICDKGFTAQVYLQQHNRFVHLKLSKKNKTTQELEEEDNRIKEFCKLSCELCGEECDNLLNLKKHFKSNHNVTGYVTCCNKRFYKRVRLVEHIDFHKNPEKFHCSICNKNYADQEGLSFHMVNIHTPDEMKTFKCTKCDKSFIKAYQLATHMAYHIPESEHKFSCENCEKRFASQEFLNRHIRAHHSQRHICEVCAREFKRPSEFRAHMLKHDSNYKPNRYQCPYCPSKLTTSSNLKKHVRQHEDKTEYFCDICGQKAPHKVALQNHKRRVHFTTRIHNCNLCSKSFKTKINLKEHTATHTGETLYTCDFCPKTFISNANFASHRKKMHPKEWMESKLKKKMEKEMGVMQIIAPRGRPPLNYQSV